MKSIEEYKINGNVGSEPKNGEARVYTTHIKNKAGLFGLMSSLSNSWTVKISSAIIVGAITAASLTGCSDLPKEPIVIEEPVQPEITTPILHEVQTGESLWKIAGYYRDEKDIQQEINKISYFNKLNPNGVLNKGTKIIIDVPDANPGKLAVEVDQAIWEMNEIYIASSFDVNPNQVHPENVYFWRVKGETEELLMQAASERYTLEEMQSMPDLYSEERIAAQISKISRIYAEALKITKTATGKEFSLEEAKEEYAKTLEEKNIGVPDTGAPSR